MDKIDNQTIILGDAIQELKNIPEHDTAALFKKGIEVGYVKSLFLKCIYHIYI